VKRISACLPALLLPAVVAVAAPTLDWVSTFDGGGATNDVINFSLINSRGNVVIAGQSNDGSAGAEMTIIEVDAVDGSYIWERRYGVADGSDMVVTDMLEDAYGDLFVGGYEQACVG